MFCTNVYAEKCCITLDVVFSNSIVPMAEFPGSNEIFKHSAHAMVVEGEAYCPWHDLLVFQDH